VLWLRVWSPVRVEAVRVDRATVIQEAFGRGTIESQREAAVGFDLVGRLSEVLVEEGARVTLGQELARLQTDQAQADLRSAQRGVSAARTSLLRLSADEQRVRALLLAAERENARAQTLFSSGAIASLQRDEANDRLRLAHADLDRVLAQRSEATRGIDVAAGGAEQRRVTMVRATLLAPFDGLITRRLREPGDTVTVGSTVLRIVDTSQVYVSAAIDETVLPLLAVDQRSHHRLSGRRAPGRGAALEDPLGGRPADPRAHRRGHARAHRAPHGHRSARRRAHRGRAPGERAPHPHADDPPRRGWALRVRRSRRPHHRGAPALRTHRRRSRRGERGPRGGRRRSRGAATGPHPPPGRRWVAR
jgi:HlyD family secretion protein